MWYFHVMVCMAGTMNCITGHMEVPQAHNKFQCYYETAGWVKELSQLQIGQRDVDVSFKCEMSPTDVKERPRTK